MLIYFCVNIEIFVVFLPIQKQYKNNTKIQLIFKKEVKMETNVRLRQQLFKEQRLLVKKIAQGKKVQAFERYRKECDLIDDQLQYDLRNIAKEEDRYFNELRQGKEENEKEGPF